MAHCQRVATQMMCYHSQENSRSTNINTDNTIEKTCCKYYGGGDFTIYKLRKCSSTLIKPATGLVLLTLDIRVEYFQPEMLRDETFGIASSSITPLLMAVGSY